MRNARIIGLGFLLMGLGISYLYLSSLNEIGSTLKILMAGPIITGLSLGMIILPGYNLTEEEWAVKENRVPLIMKNTKIGVKGFWMGMGILFLYLTEQGIFDSLV